MVIKTYGIDRAAFNQGINAKYDISIEEELSAPLVARGPNAVGVIYAENCWSAMCERLQRGLHSMDSRRQTNCGGGYYEDMLNDSEKSVISFQERSGCEGGGKGILIQEDHVGAIGTVQNQRVLHGLEDKTYCLQGNGIDRADTAGCNGRGWTEDVSYTLNTIDRPAVCRRIVRRLTPMECERLQGYPDGWTDIGEWIDSKGKKRDSSDAARYKALGNSIALPYWEVLAKRISAMYDRPATMASLFDGLGGFPKCWQKINGDGTAIWASEIEEFPIAVTKYHFGEENE